MQLAGVSYLGLLTRPSYPRLPAFRIRRLFDHANFGLDRQNRIMLLEALSLLVGSGRKIILGTPSDSVSISSGAGGLSTYQRVPGRRRNLGRPNQS